MDKIEEVKKGMYLSDKCQFCHEFGEKVEPYLCEKCRDKIFGWLNSKGWTILQKGSQLFEPKPDRSVLSAGMMIYLCLGDIELLRDIADGKIVNDTKLNNSQRRSASYLYNQGLISAIPLQSSGEAVKITQLGKGRLALGRLG